MGFKLPGIKNHGTKASSSPIKQTIDERSGDPNVFFDDRDAKAAARYRALNPEGFGATFNPLDTRQYNTSNKFPYLKSRYRLLGGGDLLKETDPAQYFGRGFDVLEREDDFAPMRQVVVGYEPVRGYNTQTQQWETFNRPVEETRGGQYLGKKDYTPEEIRDYRLDLNVLTPGGGGFKQMEADAKKSARLSNAANSLYEDLVTNKINQKQFKQGLADLRTNLDELNLVPSGPGQQAINAQLDLYDEMNKQILAADVATDLIPAVRSLKELREKGVDLNELYNKPTAVEERGGNYVEGANGEKMPPSGELIEQITAAFLPQK